MISAPAARRCLTLTGHDDGSTRVGMEYLGDPPGSAGRVDRSATLQISMSRSRRFTTPCLTRRCRTPAPVWWPARRPTWPRNGSRAPRPRQLVTCTHSASWPTNASLGCLHSPVHRWRWQARTENVRYRRCLRPYRRRATPRPARRPPPGSTPETDLSYYGGHARGCHRPIDHTLRSGPDADVQARRHHEHPRPSPGAEGWDPRSSQPNLTGVNRKAFGGRPDGRAPRWAAGFRRVSLSLPRRRRFQGPSLGP